VNSPFSLVDRFGSGLAPLSPAESIGGGFSGATVLKAVCRDGTCAVRGWPASADPHRLRGLHRLLRHVAGQGVPVAVPLADVTGDTLVRAEGRWWQVEPWLPGRADFHNAPTDAKLEAAMTTLAEFHLAAATFVPRPGEEVFQGPQVGTVPAVRDRKALMLRRVFPGEREMVASRIPSSDSDEFAGLARRAVREFERLAERVFADLRLVEVVTVPLQPVLRDVWHDHVLFTGTAVTGLIDASAARRDTVALDLSRLLGSLLGDDPNRWNVAIAAYHRRRPLSPDEAALIPLLGRSGVILSAATWLRRRYLFGEPCETPEVIARLRGYVERMERMESRPTIRR